MFDDWLELLIKLSLKDCEIKKNECVKKLPVFSFKPNAYVYIYIYLILTKLITLLYLGLNISTSGAQIQPCLQIRPANLYQSSVSVQHTTLQYRLDRPVEHMLANFVIDRLNYEKR